MKTKVTALRDMQQMNKNYVLAKVFQQSSFTTFLQAMFNALVNTKKVQNDISTDIELSLTFFHIQCCHFSLAQFTLSQSQGKSHTVNSSRQLVRTITSSSENPILDSEWHDLPKLNIIMSEYQTLSDKFPREVEKYWEELFLKPVDGMVLAVLLFVGSQINKV